MQTLHLETAWFVSWYRYNCLLSFEDPVLKHSWQLSCAIHMPFINIIKYLFHYSNFHTIRPLPHRLQSTWNRILNETDNATWSLRHLELWGIFLFNTLMLFCGFSQPEDMFVLMMTLIIINTNMSSGWENPQKTSEITKRNFEQWLEQWLQQAGIFFPTRAANNHANITSWNSLVCFLVSIQLSTEFWRSSSETQLTAILCHSYAIHRFINIIKYLFHYSNFHTIRTFPHRLQSTWNRILNKTDNTTWSLGHLELWGIFLFNTLMLFRLGKPTEDQRNHQAKLCAMAWAMATTGSDIFSNKGCEQSCKHYILKQLGLFPGIDTIVYWVLKIQFWNTADSYLVPFICHS